MNEVLEKIIGKLVDKRKTAERLIMENPQDELDKIQTQTAEDFAAAYGEAIDIVKQAAAEYNNGWIPCEEEMPKEHDSIFAKLKGTDKWNDKMFEKISDTVNVTVVDEYGNGITTHAHTVDGKWSCDLLKLNKTYKITAWQSLPEPYQPKGE